MDLDLKLSTRTINSLLKLKIGDFMKSKILTKVVGVQYHEGTVEVGETVQIVKDTNSEFPQVLAVLNEAGEQVGNIVSNVDDFDLVVNEVVNNFQLYDEVDKYEFKVKRVAKYYVMLVGTLKSTDDEVSLEELETLVKNLKESIHLLIVALDDAQYFGDVLLESHLKAQIDEIIALHNAKSIEVIEMQNKLLASKGRVFDYTKQSAK